jgi:dienelactone hydrolase
MQQPSRYRPAMRGTAVAIAAGAFAVLLLAAEPTPRLDELDEVVVYAVKPKPIPLIDFLDFPQFDSVVISPGGTYVATGWGEDNFQRRLSVSDFPSMKSRSTGLMQMYFGVTDVRWVDESRLLVQPTWPLHGFRRLREHLGTIMITDINGRTLHELSPAPVGVTDQFDRLRKVEQVAMQVKVGPDTLGPNAFGPLRVIAARPASTDQILIQTLWNGNESDTGGFGVFRLDLQPGKQVGKTVALTAPGLDQILAELRGPTNFADTTGSMPAVTVMKVKAAFELGTVELRSGKQSRVAMLPLRGGQVITGPDQRAALAFGKNEADEELVYYLPESRRIAGKDWQLLVRSGSGERGLRPLVWSGQGEEYYALDGRDQPTRAVVMWNAKNNTQKILFRHPDADMDVVWQDPSGKPWMFSGASTAPVYWYPDPAHPLARLHRLLTQHVAPGIVEVMNSTDDLTKAVVRVSSGARAPIFFVVDVDKAVSIVGMHTYPKLKTSRLAQVKPIEFPARDGLAIRGYLTTPLEIDGTPRSGLPLLVISHAGPRGEVSEASYEFERQLFASRGYAVLQINARGSGGRGAAFEQAGDGKWGHEVQDDFADGVRWAIKDGVAAPDRTCFYGTNDGAYSALVAAARAPELFQCVIGVGGAFDLPLLLTGKVTDKKGVQTVVQKEIPLALRRAIGDREELRARSPVALASSIKAKVFLMHQRADKLAPEEQMKAMERALKSAGNPARTQIIGQGQQYLGYFTPQTREPVYETMIRYLDQHIGDKVKTR